MTHIYLSKFKLGNNGTDTKLKHCIWFGSCSLKWTVCVTKWGCWTGALEIWVQVSTESSNLLGAFKPNLPPFYPNFPHRKTEKKHTRLVYEGIAKAGLANTCIGVLKDKNGSPPGSWLVITELQGEDVEKGKIEGQNLSSQMLKPQDFINVC